MCVTKNIVTHTHTVHTKADTNSHIQNGLYSKVAVAKKMELNSYQEILNIKYNVYLSFVKYKYYYVISSHFICNHNLLLNFSDLTKTKYKISEEVGHP